MSEKGRLLIVDDETAVRDSLGRWFAGEGFEVGTAASAAQALQRMAEGRWDLALVDIQTPGADGIELQQRLRQADANLIIIIMTGYASIDTAVAALKNGVYGYVTKPFDPRNIAHTVRNALSHRSALEENARLKKTVSAAQGEIPPSDFTLPRPGGAPVARSLHDVERAHILRVLEECGGNQTHAAGILEIDRVTLHNRLKRYGWKKVGADA